MSRRFQTRASTLFSFTLKEGPGQTLSVQMDDMHGGTTADLRDDDLTALIRALGEVRTQYRAALKESDRGRS